MNTNLEHQDLLTKIEALTLKWKDKTPVKYSAEYWRMRADRLLFLALKEKLETATPKKNV